MVLLHGLTGHAHIWDHMAPALAERYRVLAPDQRGHGDTRRNRRRTRRRSSSTTSRRCVGALGLDRFVLMGLSMGGHNAMSYTAQHPDGVERLIVIDIPPAMDRDTRAELGDEQAPRARPATSATRRSTKRCATRVPARRPRRRRTCATARSGTCATADGGSMQLKYDAKVPARWEPEDLWPRARPHHVPTLLVRGGLTTVLPRDVAERMVAALPDAEFVEIATSGHSVPTDRPEELAPIVLEWLARGA